MPSFMTARWARTTASPRLPVLDHAQTPAGSAAAWSARGVVVQRPMAAAVASSTAPVAGRPRRDWYVATAAAVYGPKTPSAPPRR